MLITEEFIFEQANTGKRSKITVENSDEALALCFKVNGWKGTEIIYVGRASVVENPAFLSYRDELHYTPGSHF